MMNRYWGLIKRELWEHTSLFKIPAIFFVVVVLGNLAFGDLFRFVDISPDSIQRGVIRGALGTVNSIAFIVFIFLSAFYLLDCLYSERKDQSILFWRSLPVSDTETVLVKLVTAVIVIPAILWLTLVAAHLLTLILQSLQGTDDASSFLGVLSLGKYWLNLAFVLGITMLWSLPLLCWFLFCSSWTERTPLVTVIAIPVIIGLVDIVLPFDLNIGSHMLSRLPFGFGDQGGALDQLLGLSALGMANSNAASPALQVLGRADIWIGLLIAIALVVATVQVRRWRDAS